MVASVRPAVTTRASAPRMKIARSGEIQPFRDDLVGLLAHDLNTPLATLSMNLDFLLSELPPEALGSMRAALEDSIAANTRAVRIVSDMADAARLASGELEAEIGDIDAREMLAQVVTEAAPEAASRGVHILWTADVDVVRGDQALLPRALHRLVERGLRHVRPGGAIDIALCDNVVMMRARAPASPGGDGSGVEQRARALATHFADAAMRAQGGAVRVECDGEGSLLFCVELPG